MPAVTSWATRSSVAGVRIRAPMMQIHTVAAGGGSICRFDGMRFRVGPESAGAQPGAGLLPRRRAADGHRLQPVPRPDRAGAFPGRVRAGRRPAARSRGVARAACRRSPTRSAATKSLEEIAEGFLDIAVDNMAAAIRKISIARGHDVTRYTLACFGGAGGQHACRVADALGMERILIHPLAGVLSAYGIGLADVKAIREASWLKPLSEDFSDGACARWKRRRAQRSGRAGRRAEPASSFERRARLRTPGSDTTLEVAARLRRRRCARPSPTLHRRRFGYVDETARSIVDALIVEAIAHTGTEAIFSKPAAEPRRIGRRLDASRREQIRRAAIDGPALIFDPSSTTVVEPGWRAERAGDGTLILTRAAPARTRHMRSAPTSIRCGSRSSTTCSWPSPRKWASRCSRPRPRSTSRSGSISPARCSTRRAR